MIARILALAAIHAATWFGMIVIALAIGGVAVTPGPMPILVGGALIVSLLHVSVLAWSAARAAWTGWPLAIALSWSYLVLTVVDPLVGATTQPAARLDLALAVAAGALVGGVFFVPLVVWFMERGGAGAMVRWSWTALVPRLAPRELLFRTVVLAAVVVPGLGFVTELIAGGASGIWRVDVYPLLALRGALWVAAIVPLQQLAERGTPRAEGAALAIAALVILPNAHRLVPLDAADAQSSHASVLVTAAAGLAAAVAIAGWLGRRAL